MRTKKSPKRANIARINIVAVRPLLALASDKVEREDGLSKLYLPPQVPVASLHSPAVMDLEAMLGPWTQARSLALTAASGSLPLGP